MNPPGAQARESRYSIPFFLHPNPDYVIKTLPECISEENPNRYPASITANEFLVERLREIKLM
jgi:isopenicillin N synthase-like dioxygenase